MPETPEMPDAAETSDDVPARQDTPTASETGDRGSGGPAPSEPIETPEHIGPYRIRERLGEGGFGVVYLAEQTEPVRRRVALKVIKPGMDTERVVARFTAERQRLPFVPSSRKPETRERSASHEGSRRARTLAPLDLRRRPPCSPLPAA